MQSTCSCQCSVSCKNININLDPFILRASERPNTPSRSFRLRLLFRNKLPRMKPSLLTLAKICNLGLHDSKKNPLNPWIKWIPFKEAEWKHTMWIIHNRLFNHLPQPTVNKMRHTRSHSCKLKNLGGTHFLNRFYEADPKIKMKRLWNIRARI